MATETTTPAVSAEVKAAVKAVTKPKLPPIDEQASWHHSGCHIKRVRESDWSKKVVLASWREHEVRDKKTGEIVDVIETIVPIVLADIQIVARGGDTDTHGWGIVVAWHDPAGAEHIEILRDLTPDKVVAQLRNGGAWVSPEASHKSMLVHWLQSAPVSSLAVLRGRTGWSDDSSYFVQPNGNVTGETGHDRKVFFAGASKAAKGWQQQGSLKAWQAAVGELCQASDRALFAVCCALAAPLLKASGEPSGGFCLVGESGDGKSTALRAGTSVWAHPTDFEKGFDMSAAGPEALANAHNDLFLPLDEMGKASPDSIQKIIYTLANGSGRARSGVAGDLRDVATWRTLFCATSEKTISDIVAASKAGGGATVGVEHRLLELNSRGQAGGIFDRLPEGTTRDSITSSFYQSIRGAHGAAGQAWLEWLSAHASEVADLHRQVDAMRDSMAEPQDTAQTRRALRRFGLVAVAAALAEAAGVLPRAWGAVDSVQRIMKAWKASQETGSETSELAKARRALRDWIMENQATRMTARLKDGIDGPVMRHARLEIMGYLDMRSEARVFLTPAAFDQILHKANLNTNLSKAALVRAGDIIKRGERIDEKAPSALDKGRARVIELRGDVYAPPALDEIAG